MQIVHSSTYRFYLCIHIIDRIVCVHTKLDYFVHELIFKFFKCGALLTVLHSQNRKMGKKRKLDDHKRQWNIRWLVDDNGEPRKWLHYDKV